MARKQTADPRFDFRGGVVTALSEELLDARELRRLENGRATRGAIEPRLGSKRIHVTPIPGGAHGGVQWDAPAGREVVAIAADGLYHKRVGDADFTKVAQAFDATLPVSFVAHRVGATIVLYIANGALYRWDGTTLTTIAGASVPAARSLALYLGRGFATDGTKRLYASKVQDLTQWAAGEAAVFADVETFDTEPIVALAKVGGSLALAKADNIARFVGVDPADIRIDTQTRGISGEAGVQAVRSFIELEQGAFGVSDRGPFVCSDANLDLTIGDKIQDQFENATPADRDGAIAVHHRGRREVWVWLGAVVWVWHYDTRTWHGPWTGMPAKAVCRYQRADGTETILRFGADGYVREEDLGTKDDVLRDGTGGTAVTCRAQLPAMTFGDPSREKFVGHWQEMVADLPVGSLCSVEWASERAAGTVQIQPATVATGPLSYPWRPLRAKGVRFTFTLVLSSPPSGAGARILSVVLTASEGSRTPGPV